MSISAVQPGSQVPPLVNLASTAVAKALDSNPYSLTWTEPGEIKKEEMTPDQLRMKIMKPIRHVNESLHERIIQRLNIYEALRAVEGLNDEAKALVLMRIAEVQAQIGDIGEAKATVEEAKRVAKDWRGEWPDLTKVFIGIAKVQVQIGDIGEARTTLAKAKQSVGGLEEEWHQAKGFVEIAKVQVQIGDIEEARTTLAEAKQPAKVVLERDADESCMARLLIRIAEVQVQMGDIEEAKATVEEAKRHFEDLNDWVWYQAKVHIEFAAAQARLMQTSVSELPEASVGAGQNSQIVAPFMVSLLGDANIPLNMKEAVKAHIAEAKYLVEDMHEDGHAAEGCKAFRKIAAVLGQIGDIDGAKEAIAKAKQMVVAEEERLAGPPNSAWVKGNEPVEGWSKKKAFRKIAAVQAQIGDIDEAREWVLADFGKKALLRGIAVEMAKYTKGIVKSPVREVKGLKGQIGALIALTQKQQRQIEELNDQIKRPAKKPRLGGGEWDCSGNPCGRHSK